MCCRYGKTEDSYSAYSAPAAAYKPKEYVAGPTRAEEDATKAAMKVKEAESKYKHCLAEFVAECGHSTGYGYASASYKPEPKPTPAPAQTYGYGKAEEKTSYKKAEEKTSYKKAEEKDSYKKAESSYKKAESSYKKAESSKDKY